MSTPWQIKKIHTLKTFLHMNDDIYREMLYSFQVCSSKQLTDTEAKIFISRLEELVSNCKANLSKNYKKYDELIGRDEKMATPLQLRKLEAVWNEIQQLRPKEERTSLKSYLLRHFKVYNIRFLTRVRAGDIIGVLDKILKKKLEEYILKAF